MRLVPVLAQQIPNVRPNPGSLPFTTEVAQFASSIMFFGIIACIVGGVVSLAAIAAGNAFSNGRLSSYGKVGLVASVVGGAVIPLVPALIRFFNGALQGGV